uniref:Importin-13 n=1 Tax=Branchiostoma floridae TaxID=7739 RepID=C3ZJ96_BRAFL|eukprot:XP_002591416.1 hypothetical protein BRAFLDRAFT_119258 [Branchiostoma floridae]
MEGQAQAEFTVENIERALHQLYFDPNVSVKDAAQKWLMAAQVSPQAWQFCWVLLQKDKAAEVQFFGANALYVKISHHWTELPADHYANLRTQLFQQILAFAGGPRMVLTRLCVALSAFALNTMPEVWAEAVKGIVDTFQQASGSEITHNTTCLAQSRRGTVRNAMQEGLPHVLPLLQTLLEQPSPLDVQQQALKCFSSWVTFGVPLNEVEGLTNLAFKAVRSPELFDVAIDALVNVVLQPMAYKYPNTVQKFIPQVLQLQDMLETAIKDKDMDDMIASEPQDDMIASEPQVFQEHCAYFIPSLTHSFLLYPQDDMIASEPQDDMIASEPQVFQEHCAYFIPFTHSFLPSIPDDMIASEPQVFQEHCAYFIPLYMNLVEIMLIKVQYPPDSEYASWTAEEKEQFRCYRQDIADTLVYAFNLLRDSLLNFLFAMLSTILQQDSKQQEETWQNALTGNVMKDILNYLHAILGPHVQQLEASLNEQPSASSKAIVVQKLNMLSMLFSALDIRRPESEEAEKRQPKPRADEPQPVLLVLQQVYPIVQRLVSQWIADTGVIECLIPTLTAVCEMFKRAVRTLQDEIAPMTTQLSELLVQVYNAIPQSAVLDMAKQVSYCCHDYGILATLLPWLHAQSYLCNTHIELVYNAIPQSAVLDMAKQLTSRTVSLFQQGIREHPDLVEGFMSLAGSMLKRCPAVLFQENSNPEALFQCGLMALSFPESHVVKATCIFFAELIGQSASNPLVLQVVTQHGRMLLEVVLKAIGGDAPRSVTDNMADILMALNKNCFQQTCTWMGEVMKVEGFPSQLVNAQQKEQFARNVLNWSKLRRRSSSQGTSSNVMKVEGFPSGLVSAQHKEQFARNVLKCNVLKLEGFPSQLDNAQQKEQFARNVLQERVNKRKMKETVKDFSLLCRGLYGTDFSFVVNEREDMSPVSRKPCC